MRDFHYTKPFKFMALFGMTAALLIQVQAESNIDRYRNKNKPMVRRYQEKLNIGKDDSSAIKAKKRALPPAAFKQKGLFSNDLSKDLPNQQMMPIAETPYIPEERKPNQPLINGQKFRDPNERTESIFEDPNDEKNEGTQENILDFNNLAGQILSQNIGDASILENGILPDEEGMTQDRDGERQEEQSFFEAENDSAFSRILGQNDTVSPFQPGIAAPGDTTSSATRIFDANENGSAFNDVTNLDPEANAGLDPTVSDQRLSNGANEFEELTINGEETDEFSQSRSMIDSLVSPHVNSFNDRIESKYATTTEQLLAKYSITPPDLSFDRSQKGDEKDSTDALKHSTLDRRNSFGSLESNPAISSQPGTSFSSSFRPTADVNGQTFGDSSFSTVNERQANNQPSPFNGFASSNEDQGYPSDTSLPGNNQNSSNTSFGGPTRADFQNMPTLRMGSTVSRFEVDTRNRSSNRNSNQSMSNNRPGFSAGNNAANTQRPSFDLMNDSREKHRVKSSFGNNGNNNNAFNR